MRLALLSSTLIASVFAAGLAFAAQTSGTVTAINAEAGTVTLNDGNTYAFDDQSYQHTVLGGYRPGDAVVIIWDGDNRRIDAMSPDFAASTTGRIATIDQAVNTVTLDNGVTYRFDIGADVENPLAGFRPGDVVSIVATDEGGEQLARSIASHVASDVTGKVATVNAAQSTVTLENGMTYMFDQGTDIGGYKTGDAVRITALRVGTSMMGQAISPA